MEILASREVMLRWWWCWDRRAAVDREIELITHDTNTMMNELNVSGDNDHILIPYNYKSFSHVRTKA